PIPIRPITIDGRTGKPPAPAPTPTPAPAPTPAPGHNYGGITQPAPPPPKPAPAPGHNYGGITQPAPAPAPTPPASTIPQAGGSIHTGPVPNKPLVPPQRTPVGTPPQLLGFDVANPYAKQEQAVRDFWDNVRARRTPLVSVDSGR